MTLLIVDWVYMYTNAPANYKEFFHCPPVAEKINMVVWLID